MLSAAPISLLVMTSLLGDSTVPVLVLAGAAAAASATYAARRNMFSSHDPREPPLAPSSIPLIGHAVGMSRSAFNYYVELRCVGALLTLPSGTPEALADPTSV
jgi:hypothetical protein